LRRGAGPLRRHDAQEAVLAAAGPGVPVVRQLCGARGLWHQRNTVLSGAFGAESLSHHDQPDLSLSEFAELVCAAVARHSRDYAADAEQRAHGVAYEREHVGIAQEFSL